MPWKDPNRPASLHVWDLFSGLESVAKGFRARGHTTFTLDFDPQFEPDTCIDILEWDWTAQRRVQQPDVIWASPPCEAFSVARIGTNWSGSKTEPLVPKTEKAELGLRLLERTVHIIQMVKPRLFFIENPRGAMRRAEVLQNPFMCRRETVTYCQYGKTYMKPTDIWTNSRTWTPRPACKPGQPCHEAAPRGAKTGTQGLANAALRAVIPEELVHEIVLVCEDEI